jgi:ankyrin repeat protein
MIASYFGIERIVKFLLGRSYVEVGAVDQTYRHSALSWASENGFHSIIKLLIKRPKIRLKKWKTIKKSFAISAEVNTRDSYGRTLLSYAAWNGHMAVVELLTDAGARVSSKDEIGGTPVSYALCCGQAAVASRLIKGAQADSVEKIRQELLLSAAEKGHKPTIKRLLENGAAIEGVDSTGRTPLSWAAKGGHEAIVKLLVDRGAIIEAMDSTGRTPLSYAAVNGHDAIVQLLVATSQVNVRRATIHEGEPDFQENVIELQAVGKLDTIDPHSVELDHHVQGSPLVPGGSDAGDATEMIS